MIHWFQIYKEGIFGLPNTQLAVNEQPRIGQVATISADPGQWLVPA